MNRRTYNMCDCIRKKSFITDLDPKQFKKYKFKQPDAYIQLYMTQLNYSDIAGIYIDKLNKTMYLCLIDDIMKVNEPFYTDILNNIMVK